MSGQDQDWKRWTVLALAVVAVICFALAYFFPMWGFYLYSPQYPDGLILSVYLNRVAGDVTEINVLNHYIGMAKLDEAAQLERALSGYGLIGISLLTLLFVFAPTHKVSKYYAIPAISFPFVFLGLFYYWMYSFGHELAPEAPIRIAPFTPTMIGHGRIGNFETIGMPGAGFYLIITAMILVIVAFYVRQSVCDVCPYAGECKAMCPKLFLGRKNIASK